MEKRRNVGQSQDNWSCAGDMGHRGLINKTNPTFRPGHLTQLFGMVVGHSHLSWLNEMILRHQRAHRLVVEVLCDRAVRMPGVLSSRARILIGRRRIRCVKECPARCVGRWRCAGALALHRAPVRRKVHGCVARRV